MKGLLTAGLLILASCAPVATPMPAPAPAPAWLPVSPENLAGTWELAEVNGQPFPRAFVLTFRADGRAKGSLNCGNHLQGVYRIGPHHLFGIGGSVSERGCDIPPPLVAAEKSLLSPSSAWLSPDGRQLAIHGLEKLEFRRTD